MGILDSFINKAAEAYDAVEAAYDRLAAAVSKTAESRPVRYFYDFVVGAIAVGGVLTVCTFASVAVIPTAILASLAFIITGIMTNKNINSIISERERQAAIQREIAEVERKFNIEITIQRRQEAALKQQLSTFTKIQRAMIEDVTDPKLKEKYLAMLKAGEEINEAYEASMGANTTEQRPSGMLGNKQKANVSPDSSALTESTPLLSKPLSPSKSVHTESTSFLSQRLQSPKATTVPHSDTPTESTPLLSQSLLRPNKRAISPSKNEPTPRITRERLLGM